LEERLRAGRITAMKARAADVARAANAETARRRRYIRDVLTPEHLREHDYEGNAYADVDRILARLDADGTLMLGDLLTPLRPAAKGDRGGCAYHRARSRRSGRTAKPSPPCGERVGSGGVNSEPRGSHPHPNPSPFLPLRGRCPGGTEGAGPRSGPVGGGAHRG